MSTRKCYKSQLENFSKKSRVKLEIFQLEIFNSSFFKIPTREFSSYCREKKGLVRIDVMERYQQKMVYPELSTGAPPWQRPRARVVDLDRGVVYAMLTLLVVNGVNMVNQIKRNRRML